MPSKVRGHHPHPAHARIWAWERHQNNRIGLLVLVIVFVALIAILLRLAEFAGRGAAHNRAAPDASALHHD